MTSLSAYQLRTRVTLTFILTILAIGLIVSAVAFGALVRTYMKASIEQHKLHLNSKQEALGNCLEHLIEQSIQIHSCSLCSNMLESYADNLHILEDMEQYNTLTLSHALNSSEMLEGIVRTDLEGNVIANLGHVSPHDVWPYVPGDNGTAEDAPKKVIFSSIILELDTLRIITITPIKLDNEVLGYDILFFSPIHFLDILHDSSVEATALFHPAHGDLIVWSGNTYSDHSNKNPPATHAKVKQIIRELEPPPDTNSVQEWPQTSSGEQLQFIYARIPGSEWFIGSYIKDKMSFSSMLRQHISILFIIFGLSCSGGILCYLALRPLTRGFVTLTARLEHANTTLKDEISERRQIEADLRLSEEQWANTFASIEDAIFVLDAEGHINKQNSAARKLRAAYNTAHCSGIFLPKDRQPSAIFKNVMEHNISIKKIYEDPSGSTFRITLTPIKINQRNIGAVHLVRDITEETRGKR